MEGVVIIVILAVAFASGFASQYIASARGRTETWFFWLGFFFPIIGIVVAFGTPAAGRAHPAQVTDSVSNVGRSLANALADLAALHQNGALSDSEFEAAKRKLLES